MKKKKTKEELIKEAMRCEDRVREEEGKYHYGWALEEAAEKWEKAGDAEKAREYYIKAAENVTGYNDEIDEKRGLLYEKAGELTMAAECYYVAISYYTTLDGCLDLHGESKPGKMEADMLRKHVEGLLDKGLLAVTLQKIIAKEEEKRRDIERFFWAYLTKANENGNRKI